MSPFALPELSPMLATPGTLPPDQARWAFEVKWDGIRVLAYLPGDGRWRLVSRNRHDVTARYPELEVLPGLLPATDVVLDGEVVAMDARGRPSFGRLQERMGLNDTAAIRAAMRATPVSLMVFDVLWARGGRVTALPYTARRELLEGLGLDSGPVGTPPAWPGDGDTAMAWTRDTGLEGVMAKRLGSPYRPGTRTRDWVKVKHRRTLDVRVGGWIAADPDATVIKSLLVGTEETAGLRYRGAVGTGFTHRQRGLLAERLRALETPVAPFVNPGQALGRGFPVRWVEPVLTGEVEFAELTATGQMRMPVWRGLRGADAP
jgi:bifunctional non-homologous end joining protein LigD